MHFRTWLSLVALASCQDTPCGQTPVPPNANRQKRSDSSVAGEIVGGKTAIPYSWPWQVVLEQTYKAGEFEYICGGSIVGNGWVLTAAHCVDGGTVPPEKFRVKAGVFNRSAIDEQGEVILDVKAIHTHPKFTIIDYDIALVELKSPIKYMKHIQPVCLPSHDDNLEGKALWTTGWGRTGEKAWFADQLMEVKVPFVNASTCDRDYNHSYIFFKKDIMICAGKWTKGICWGDSGGPLVLVVNGGTWLQYGVTSWSNGCGRDNQPEVYARVTTFCGWISNTTDGAVKCRP